MKKRAARAPSRTPAETFQAGQIWKVDDVNLAVTMVGKTLVHYKRYKTQPKGIQTTLCTKVELERYLSSKKAVLLTE